jgi:ribosomal protein L12E/L44/L45/RPP1/RPP2
VHGYEHNPLILPYIFQANTSIDNAQDQQWLSLVEGEAVHPLVEPAFRNSRNSQNAGSTRGKDKEDREEEEEEGQGDDEEREEDEQPPPPLENTRKKSKRGRKSR